MIKNNDEISPYQLGMLIIMTVVGVGIFSMPAEMAKAADQDAWIMIMLGGIINLPFALIMVKLNTKHPGKTFIEYTQIILGKVPGKILGFLFVTIFVVITALVLRAFTEVTKMFMLFRTPTEVIIFTLIITCTYLIRGGIECVARIMEVTFSLLFIPFFLIFLPGLINVDITNLMPVLYEFPSKIFKSMAPMLLSFGGYECILFYIGFMKDPKKAYKPVIYSIAFITFLYVFITAACIANFGAKFLSQMLWPVLMYVKGISLPGLFLERLDGIMLALWVITIFTTVVSLFYICTYTISKIIGTKEQKQYVLPLSIIIYYISLQPQDIAQLSKWTSNVLKYGNTFFMYAIPLILLIISSFSRRGSRPQPLATKDKGGNKKCESQPNSQKS